MDEEPSSLKKHQPGDVHPVVNCDKKASGNDNVIISSIAVVRLAHNVVNFTGGF